MEQSSRQSYWMSYSDLATCLILAFVLIIVSMLSLLKKEISETLGIKEEMIEDLKEEFKEDDLAVRVDEKTGDLLLPSELLFEFGSVQLSDRGRTFLAEFMPRYLHVVFAEKFKEQLAEVVVEGHADTVGTYLTNLEFSHSRAYSVLRYLMTVQYDEPTMEGRLRELASANGRSESEPIYDSEGLVECAASRRVEFRFRLRDEKTIERIQEIVGGN